MGILVDNDGLLQRVSRRTNSFARKKAEIRVERRRKESLNSRDTILMLLSALAFCGRKTFSTRIKGFAW